MNGRSSTSRSRPSRSDSVSNGSPARVSVTCQSGSAPSGVTFPSPDTWFLQLVVQEHQVVPVNDLSLVRGPQLAGELAGRASQQSWEFRRTIVHQSAGHGVTLFVAQVHWVARGEVAVDPDDPRRQ